MTQTYAREIADRLVSSSPRQLSSLAKDDHGLYALFDHRGRIRYVGQTACNGGFRKRIYNNHVTGSNRGRPGTDGRSHKFASEYIPLMGRSAAPSFVRLMCKAVVVPVQGRPVGSFTRKDPQLKSYQKTLCDLERQVVVTIRARGFTLDWNH